MFPFSHKTRDLTTDQGLPLDVSQAVPTASFSLDQPVYRSIDVLSAPSMAPRFVEPVFRTNPKLAEAYIDVPLGAKNLKPAAVPVDRMNVDVPSLDSMGSPLEKTHFEVSGTPSSIMEELRSLCDRSNVRYEAESEFELRCSKTCDSSFASVEFYIRLFSSSGKLIVEFQRRNGCCGLFHGVFRSAKANWHKCAPQSRRPLAAPALVRSTSLPVESSSEQWNCVVSWMKSDPREAIRSVASLANHGTMVPDDIVTELVGHLSTECRVEALQAITAAIPSHRLEGHEDAVLAAVSNALVNGDLIEEREACKFVSKAAQELPSLLSRARFNLADQLSQACRSQWPCIRQFAESSLSLMQTTSAVY
jgi:hypothetical protein